MRSAVNARIGLAGGVEFGVARECADVRSWFAGDLYGAAIGHAVALAPGAHCLVAQYAHDVRAFGGAIPPVGRIRVSAVVAGASVLATVSRLTITPSLLREGGEVRMASDYVGVTAVSESDDWICVDRAAGAFELVRPWTEPSDARRSLRFASRRAK